MPRTSRDAHLDFRDVRMQRALADRLRKSGQMSEQEWQQEQDLLAGSDRKAYAEEMVSDNPLMAIPLLGGIPADHAAKVLGITSGRSNPSLHSLAEGYRGVGQGLENSFARLLRQPRRIE